MAGPQYIDVTPTWEQSVNIFVLLIENGDTKGRATAIAELKRMARIADAYVAEHKQPAIIEGEKS
jgi:hypothetical protein